MSDASELRNSMVDLDDKQASTLRSVRFYIDEVDVVDDD